MFSRPTLAELVDRTGSDLESRLPGGDAHLLRSNLRVLAAVEAGGFHSLYGLLGWAVKQLFPQSADEIYLKKWASFWGLTPKVAGPASGVLLLTGTPTTTVPIGTTWDRSDGVRFVSTVEVELDGAGEATVDVEAETGGSTTNTASGTTLAVTTTISGLYSNAVVDSAGLTAGTDAETASELLARLLQRVQTPPQGGASADYEKWALECDGVTRAWIYPGYLGLGTVAVFVLNNDATDPIPTTETVEAVQAYIDELRPVTAAVTVFAPISTPIDFELSVSPATQTVKDAVELELTELLKREGAPGALVYLSHIREAVSQAAGEVDHVISVPSTNVQLNAGEYPVLGTITWL
jgi:uncharacterized phage protein gp47/JayE